MEERNFVLFCWLTGDVGGLDALDAVSDGIGEDLLRLFGLELLEGRVVDGPEVLWAKRETIHATMQ